MGFYKAARAHLTSAALMRLDLPKHWKGSNYFSLWTVLTEYRNLMINLKYQQALLLSMFSEALKWASEPKYIRTLVISIKMVSCYQLQESSFFIIICLEKLVYPIRMRTNLHREMTSAYTRPLNHALNHDYWFHTCTRSCSFLITVSPNVWQNTIWLKQGEL